MKRENCWEYKRCGREPGGAREGELGVCVAATLSEARGINHGSNGGRACWAIAGTLCGGRVQGTFASKLENCMNCAFYHLVTEEEGSAFMPAREVFARLDKIVSR
jgi:hypothetical protein